MKTMLKRFARTTYKLLQEPPARARARQWRTARAIASRFTAPYKLNLGCGRVRFDGWINIDSDPAVSTPDLVCDLTLGLPFEDESCRFVYCEHFLEHLSAEQGVAYLRECRRVLRPAGILRIAMPSLDVILEKSCGPNWRDQEWLAWEHYQFIQTRAEMLNIVFRWWGHQWLYDREELHRRLREAGFARIRDAERNQSDEPELCGRETRQDSLLVCEASPRDQ